MITANHITINEYCTLYKCSRKTYYNRVKAGIIPAAAIVVIQNKTYILKNKIS